MQQKRFSHHDHHHKHSYMNEDSGSRDAHGHKDLLLPVVQICPNPEQFLPIPRLKFPHAAVIVFVVSVICFSVSYNGDFVFDDNEAILGNKDVLTETPVSNVFINDFWGKKLDSKTSHKSYRPLTVLTYRFSHYLGGGLNPLFFHIPNIILHGAISVLLLCVFSILFGGYVVDTATEKVKFMAAKSSLLCALLFAVHPVHTESVSGVVGRADLLCAVLLILSLLLYVRACAVDLKHKNDKLIIFCPATFSIPYLVASMGLCFMSVFAKEQGITVIGICSAYDIIVVGCVDLLKLIGLRSQPSRRSKHENDTNKEESILPWVSSLIKRQMLLLTTAITILLLRWRIMGSTTPTFQVFDNPHSFINNTLLRVLNYNYLYAINAWLLVNPWWSCFDWSMGCVPVIDTFSDTRIIAVLALWIIIGALVWTCLQGHITQDQRSLTMALAFIIVPFLPASNLFFRVGFVIAERILYLSSIGFCMLVVLGLRKLCVTFPRHKMLMMYGFVFLLCIFTVRCIQRSKQWKTEMELFSSGVHICPLNAKVHYNIAKLNADNGNIEYAVAKYRKAIELNPEYDQAMNNLGNIMKDLNQLDEAERLLERAVAIREEFAAAWMNLGIVKASLKKHQEAEKCYFTAIRHRRNYPDCFYNLGNLYLDVKQYEQAIRAWVNATNLKPTHVNAWVNMAAIYDNLEKYEESIQAAKTGLRYLPHEAQLYFSLGNVHGKLSKFPESEMFFKKAIELSPNTAKLYANTAVLYHRWGKYQLAEEMYKKALTLDPSEPNVKENMAMLYRAMNKNKV